jgi:uncharacterized SAM-binding protein YcdF (DUF218 family)
LFFVLSKTLGIMMLPTNLLVGLLVVGALLSATRLARLGRRLVIIAVLLFVICGSLPLGSLLLYALESRFPGWDPSAGAPDGVIVLGGPIDPDLSAAHGMPVIHGSPDRIFAGAALARRYPNARIIYTGGSPNLISNDAREADFAAEIFESLGVDKSRLTLERASRNTYENAVFSKALAKPKPGERWLLVTSAFHMPRSIGLFRKAGFAVEAYPVDWRVGTNVRDILSFTPMLNEGLSRTDAGVREWTGLLAYWMTGRIDTVFPGPSVK